MVPDRIPAGQLMSGPHEDHMPAVATLSARKATHVVCPMKRGRLPSAMAATNVGIAQCHGLSFAFFAR